MNRRGKIILGIVAFAPLLSLIVFRAWLQYWQSTGAFIDTLPATIIALAIAMLLGMGLVVLFVVQVLRDPTMTTGKRLLWVLGLCAAGVLTLPVFWYLHVWRNPSAA